MDTYIIRSPLPDKNNLWIATITDGLRHEQFDGQYMATSLFCPSQTKDTTPDDFSITRIDSVYFAVARGSNDYLSESKGIAR